jgi:hypothetical protein
MDISSLKINLVSTSNNGVENRISCATANCLICKTNLYRIKDKKDIEYIL